MEQLAELSSDKEQLEHLVERLQEETETIGQTPVPANPPASPQQLLDIVSYPGDYVIMYQHQRKQQRIKIQEKEQEVRKKEQKDQTGQHEGEIENT